MNIGVAERNNVGLSYLRAMMGLFPIPHNVLALDRRQRLRNKKNRKAGAGQMNQRQLRKRAARGCAVRQESKLKQRRMKSR